MMSHEAIFVTTAIDAHDGCNLTVIDLPGDCLHMKMNEHIIMVLNDQLAEMMAPAGSKLYRKYIMTHNKGQSRLYVKILELKSYEGIVWASQEHTTIL